MFPELSPGNQPRKVVSTACTYQSPLLYSFAFGVAAVAAASVTPATAAVKATAKETKL
jgi:hypothetical protein